MMKKLLIFFGLFATVTMFASCSNDDKDNGITIPEYMSETKDSKIEVYVKGERIFKNGTRGQMEYGCDVNGNMWAQKPHPVTEQEVNEVLAYIANYPNKNTSLPKYTRYFVQHVGGAHHKYSYIDKNNALHEGIDGTSGFEHLQILENNGQWTHANNFNAGKCNNKDTNNSVLMTDGFNGIKALSEYASSLSDAYRIYYYNGFYYVGLDFSAKKGDGEVPADGIYDDWVVKIIP